MNSKKIVVLGGGSAGWLTALFLKKVLPNCKITLVESKEVGIVGVGEATTPHIVNFLQYLDVNLSDVIRNTNGTIKNAIRFDNWNGDGKNYYHSFLENIVNWSLPPIFGYDSQEFYLKHLIDKKMLFEKYVYIHELCNQNKIDLRNLWALHFDASKLATYLEQIGKERGIKVIDSKILSLKNDDNGFIQTIELEENKILSCNFVFDCTGFHRKVIGKHYGTKWKSFGKHLPMKKGIPFWLKTEKNVRPYTQAIAMKYGWMWKIPLQHRIGSGYIFDSDYINEEQALDEAEKFYGQKLEIRKIIPFDAGQFEKVWVKNCIAVGLSCSFLEPLESTSLYITISQLETFKQFLNEIDEPNEKSIELYNKQVDKMIDTSMNFIYLHYMTKRDDSDFWKNFKHNHPMPDRLKEVWTKIQDCNLRFYDFEGSFSLFSYLQVCQGLKLFEKPIRMFGHENVNPDYKEYKKMISNCLKNESMKHNEFLKRTNNVNI